MSCFIVFDRFMTSLLSLGSRSTLIVPCWSAAVFCCCLCNCGLQDDCNLDGDRLSAKANALAFASKIGEKGIRTHCVCIVEINPYRRNTLITDAVMGRHVTCRDA